MGRVRTVGREGFVQDIAGTITRYNYGAAPTKTTTLSPQYYSNYSRCADEVHPNFPYSGGPLSIMHYRQDFKDASCKSGNVVLSNGVIVGGEVHEGLRRAQPSTLMAYPSDGFESCKALGPEAWNKFKPRLAQVSLGQFIAELKDTPDLLKFQLKKFKDLGSGYLNYAFGWKPFLSDLRSWYQSIIKIDRQIANLQKHNGKWLKRGGTLYENNSVTEDQSLLLHWSNYCTILRKKRTVNTSERAWFSGAFRYYIPGLDDGKWGELKAIKELWGLDITPDLIYQLLPYSWLADWFSNVGDAISNYSSITSDNMAAKYAYIMRETKTTVDCDIDFKARYTEGTKTSYTTHSSKSTSTVITKCRAAASPYGFNVDWADFSQFQISILAALGIARQRF